VDEELPATAGTRVAAARSGDAWESALTCQEFAAVGGAGFAPVGQVFGAAVYAAGSASGYSCSGAWGASGDRMPPGPATRVSGTGDPGSFGPLVEAMYEARQTAIHRMTAECAALGGHGVVGVRLHRGSFSLGGLEFSAIGTAVRAAGTRSVRVAGTPSGPRAPFTSDLSGQDFATLIMTGWVPVGLALGISIGARHDDRTTARQARWGSGNAEVAGWTELVNRSRHDARCRLEDDVRRLGAEGVVIADMQMQVRERDCPATVGCRDHVVEVTLIGTAIASFSRAAQSHARPALAVMSLDPERRTARP
jgi:uncharacterized protein YbjQ (UPF0145 family)